MRIRIARPLRLPFATAREAWARFGDLLADQKPALVATIAIAIFGAALELLRPWPVKIVIDGALAQGDPEDLPLGLGSLEPGTSLLVAAAAVLGLSLAIGQLGVLGSVLAARIGRKITTRARRRVGEHLHRLALPFHHGADTGDLVVRVMGDIDTVRDLLFLGWSSLASRVVLFLGVALLLFLIDPVLGAVALAPVPLVVLGISLSSRRLRSVTRKQRRKVADATSFVVESLGRVHVVKAFGAEGESARSFARMVRSGEKAGVRAARLAASSARNVEFLTGAGLAFLLWFGARRVIDGAMSVGDLVVVVSYARMLYKPIRKLGRDGVRLAKAAACAERVFEVLRREPEDDEKGAEVTRIEGDLRFEDVHFSYEDGRSALVGFDATIPEGALVLLQGPNGAGKSTALAMILRMLEPDRGRVLSGGRDIRDYRLSSWRGRVSYLPQDDLLFGGTIRDNLLFAKGDATDEELFAALRSAHAEGFVSELPRGLETVLGEGGVALSRGQRRRLALARAALRPGELLLLDEPLEGLDPTTRQEVAGAIREVARGRTTLVISHGRADELDVDAILTLKRGRLAASEGTTSGGVRR